MLKRADLAKQLDLVIKQEIKNYQDSLNSVLQSIRDIKNELENIQSQSLENSALLHSEHNKLKIEFDKKNEQTLFSLVKINSFIEDQKKYDHEKHVKIESLFIMIFDKLKDFGNIIDEVTSNSVKIKELEEKVNRHCHIHDDNLVDLNMRIKKDMVKMKEDILSVPSSFVEEKKQMEDKINSHVIDVEGVLREIRLTKKEMYIMEKKIENLYTLLNRKQGDK